MHLTASSQLALSFILLVGYSSGWALKCHRGLGVGEKEAGKAYTDYLWFFQLQEEVCVQPSVASPFTSPCTPSLKVTQCPPPLPQVPSGGCLFKLQH